MNFNHISVFESNQESYIEKLIMIFYYQYHVEAIETRLMCSFFLSVFFIVDSAMLSVACVNNKEIGSSLICLHKLQFFFSLKYSYTYN